MGIKPTLSICMGDGASNNHSTRPPFKNLIGASGCEEGDSTANRPCPGVHSQARRDQRWDNNP